MALKARDCGSWGNILSVQYLTDAWDRLCLLREYALSMTLHYSRTWRNEWTAENSNIVLYSLPLLWKFTTFKDWPNHQGFTLRSIIWQQDLKIKLSTSSSFADSGSITWMSSTHGHTCLGPCFWYTLPWQRSVPLCWWAGDSWPLSCIKTRRIQCIYVHPSHMLHPCPWTLVCRLSESTRLASDSQVRSLWENI